MREGARSGGGESGPHSQPLSQRLSGLKLGNSEGSDLPEGVENLTSNASSSEGCDAMKSEAKETKSDGLRLDEPAEVSEVHEEHSSPSRGPPKTPKRTKASSPKPSDVSADKWTVERMFHLCWILL